MQTEIMLKSKYEEVKENLEKCFKIVQDLKEEKGVLPNELNLGGSSQ